MRAFTHDEEEKIYALAESLTGNCQRGSYRREMILGSVRRRMQALHLENLEDYLEQTAHDSQEFAHLVSACTIHTTAWFREMSHFEHFEHMLFKQQSAPFQKVKMLFAGCSTGEEVYSFALVLESLREKNPSLDYELVAFDIDPVCVSFAQKGLYPQSEREKIPPLYRDKLEERGEGMMGFKSPLKFKVKFYTDNLVHLSSKESDFFHFIVCRNVLIYFTPDVVKQILSQLCLRLLPGGVLIVGHSDVVPAQDLGLVPLGHASYMRR